LVGVLIDYSADASFRGGLSQRFPVIRCAAAQAKSYFWLFYI
jgi:hypothetical protein